MVAGLGEDTFGRDMGLEELLRLSLVNKDGDRFSLLPLTKSFVQNEVSANDNWMRDAKTRWVNYYDDFVDQYSGWSEDWRGHDRVEQEIANVSAVFDFLVSTLEYEGTSDRDRVLTDLSVPQARVLVRIADRVSRTLRIRGYWSECEWLAQTAIPISKATRQRIPEDRPEQPAKDQAGIYEPGWTGLSIARTTGWLSYTIARIHYYRGDIAEARIWILDMLSVAQKMSDWSMSSRAKTLLGLIELQQGRLDQAQILLNTALVLQREVGQSIAGTERLLGGRPG